MVAPPKAEAADTTEAGAEQPAGQRHPVVDRPDEHSWGAQAAGPGQETQADTTEEPVRRGPSVAVIGTAIRVLVSATEDDIMDSLETVRLKARARLASLFAQSVAEGHSAYDTEPASGADAFYDQEALVSALFDEKAVDDAIQVLSDSEVEGMHPDPARACPPPGQPKAKAPTVSSPPSSFQKAPPPPLPVEAPVAPVSKAAQKKAKHTDPQQLDPRDARQPAQPKVLSVQLVVPAEFQDYIAQETYPEDPVLTAPVGRDHPTPLFRYPPVPAHVQFGGAAPPKKVVVKSLPTKPPAASPAAPSAAAPAKPTTTPPPSAQSVAAPTKPPAASPSSTTTRPASSPTAPSPTRSTTTGTKAAQPGFVTDPVAKGNSATWSGEPKAQPVRVYPSVFPPGTVIPDVISPGVPFETSAPPYWDVSSTCRVRCPRCGLRPCGRVNRRGHRRSHSRHLCDPCKRQQE